MVREDRWRINKADTDPAPILSKDAHTGNSASCCRQGKDVRCGYSVATLPKTRRVETTLKKGQAANARYGSSSSGGLVEPKHCRLQAPVAVAESTLAHDTWRGGVWTLSKLKPVTTG